METKKITINTIIDAPVAKVWDSYTNPKHIVNWNFADPGWHCPSASNDMKVGGTYKARMEAKDGSFGFDFEAVYTEIVKEKHFTYEFGGRIATVEFKNSGSKTEVVVMFDPETENPVDMQKAGWQAILNNFKNYTETTMAA